MKYSKWVALAAMALLCGPVTQVAAAGLDLEHYLKRETFTDIKLSPGGDYYAATVPMEDRTALAILSRATGKITGSFVPPRNNHASDFYWVSDKRVLIGLAEKSGSLDTPRLTGELYAINANGGGGELLVGYRVEGNGPGTRIQPKKVEAVAAFLIDSMPQEERNVLVSVWPFSEDPYTRVDRLDISSGRRVTVARSPVRRADFTSDPGGQIRFAHGAGADNVNKLYYRDAINDSWKLVNDEADTGRIETAMGFSEDGKTAYLRVQQADGPDAIVSWDPVTGTRKPLLRDPVVDPDRLIYRPGTRVPVGALYFGDTPRTRFFDETSADARLYRSMEAAFGGDAVFITSSTRDGRHVLVEAWSGRNPGDFYIFDTVDKKAEHLISRSDWVDPDKSAKVQPFAFKARDGMELHGYLTLPTAAAGAKPPLVVMPHGGRSAFSTTATTTPRRKCWPRPDTPCCRSTSVARATTGAPLSMPAQSSGARRCRTTSPTLPAGPSRRATPMPARSASTVPATGHTRP